MAHHVKYVHKIEHSTGCSKQNTSNQLEVIKGYPYKITCQFSGKVPIPYNWGGCPMGKGTPFLKGHCWIRNQELPERSTTGSCISKINSGV